MTHNANTSPRRKTDRDEVFLEYTRSVCPLCKTVVDAQANIRDGKVYLRKRCKEHGTFEALVYGDADAYVASARFNKPGTLPLAFQTEVRDGCPTDCGLCPEHKQHACLGIIEVNSDCNLDCPICFADSGHQSDGFSLTLDQVEKMLDTYVTAEGEPEVVMFSGGEPSIHRNILDFIDAARTRPIANVVLNTNGIRLATDRRFAPALAERDVIVYLQFDGFDRATHLAIRGRDLREVKQRALDACAAAGLRVMLAAAIERDLNDHELGAIVRHGLQQPAVRGVVLQPVTHSGRHLEFDPLTRLTNSDVIQALAAQLPELLRPDDFFPVPCCFPTCRSISYLLTDGRDTVPLTRLVSLEDHLDYIANRALPDPGLRGALEKLWSASAFPGTATTSTQLDCATCGIDLPKALREVADKAFMLVVQDFQDPYTLNARTLMKCCVEMLTPDGRIIPFCAYNSVGYREQVREQLTGVPVADVVPNARELQLLLRPSPHGSKNARDHGDHS
ncbi:radical SAM protein [Kitasatospora hibisci]|uniref:radical SAM protein n=1 Tax=Kitasatospora hibisci TaxID=3369522 RepID=UPI003754DF48